jgi:shikimate kinase
VILKLKRTPGIYLVGFMGVGKTTIGQMLADELGWSFLDLDAEIEREQMRTIA